MKEFDKNKIKKQIVSGGIYIALAAAVVTVTMNGVNNIIGSSEDYEIPDVELELPKINIGTLDNPTNSENNLNLGEISDDFAGIESNEQQITNIESGITDETENEISSDIANMSQSKSENASEGIFSEILSTEMQGDILSVTDEKTVSGEPDDVEYPTEPDPVSYDNYAKPAEGYIDKEYSDDELLYSVTMGDYRTHNGIDITGDPGSNVRAINSGVITDIYSDPFYGFTIKIDHGNGITAYYMNLSETLPAGISKNVKVSHGQVIGGIGSTASIESAEVSHLHLSITVNDKYVDPREILRGNY